MIAIFPFNLDISLFTPDRFYKMIVSLSFIIGVFLFSVKNQHLY
ncbi:hypothetical protein JMA_35600 [Jeotgalibacillus malaysiensis]|uniref:Uncharacterized protein n=1 Tax=Jeotgalibacillus malaysiensis TaxID=1508404 RepID=A0A0B5AS39_9BACL|nr:hypothetical protein JMA_35600 [Jeotgalibacillus malaysiensis]